MGKTIQEKDESLQIVFGTHYITIGYITCQNRYSKVINHIKKENIKNKAQKTVLLKEKILHNITNKTLDGLKKRFKNKYNPKFTAQGNNIF